MEDATQAAVRAFAETRRLSRGSGPRSCERLPTASPGGATRSRHHDGRDGQAVQYARAEVARCITTFTLASEEARRWTGEIVPVDIEAHTTGYTR